MSLMKSLVILSSSSTSRIERGTPPEGAPAPGPFGCAALDGVGLAIGLPYGNAVEVGDGAGLGCGDTGRGDVFS